MRIHGFKLSKCDNKVVILRLILSVFCLILCIFLYGSNKIMYTIVINLFAFFTCHLLFLAASRYTQYKHTMINLDSAKASFFIYATHSIMILSVVQTLLNRIIGKESTLFSLLIYFLTAILTFIITLFTYKICSKFMPKMTSFLTGER